MTTLLNPKRAALAAVAALAVAAPAAGAASAPSGIDPAIYDAGVAPGTVMHGVSSFVISGSAGNDMNQRIEWWIASDRWRSQTTDTRTGKAVGASVHDASGTTWIRYDPPAGIPKVEHFRGNDSIPGPGYPAAYNKELLAGTEQGSEQHRYFTSLQAIGPVTIAGVTGTKYEQLVDGKTGIQDSQDGSHVWITLEDGTALPLARESTAPNGKWGQFDQKEELISREVVSADSTAGSAVTARLSKVSFSKTVKTWKAKVAKAKRASKKHHR
ncbi:hypothetical protein [Conexibacter woesei]|uniref:hypothetical protein n=1 Tax=Conexibacter woesei TaxID=191495 RepID=UPI0004277151|nr:hypothetical protein [Conexibacter woesei]